MIALSPAVVEPAARADAVDADHVRLVLDRPRPQQRRQWWRRLRGPVRDDEVAVGVVARAPRTRRRSAGRSRRTGCSAAPSIVDGDEARRRRGRSAPRRRARTDGSCGTGASCRPARRARTCWTAAVVGGRFGGDLRTRAAHPDAVRRRLIGRGTATTGRPRARRCPVVSIENPVENISVSSDQPRARSRRHRRSSATRRAKLAVAVLPDDVVLDRGDADRRHDANPARRAARPPRRSPRGACRRRTARGDGRLASS